jgi:hypothetical protein
MDHTETRFSLLHLIHSLAKRTGALTGMARLSVLCLIWAMSSMALQSCGLRGDDVTGTSSGVDNPKIAVAFTDSLGTSARISGTLSLYSQDQNPAL